jgi:hypothetical protein
MGWSAFGEALPEAITIASSPPAIVLVILLLSAPRGRVTGPVFFSGWLVGLTALTSVMFLLANVADVATDAEASDGVDMFQLGLGLVLWFLALRQFRKRPGPGETPATPKLFATVDAFGPGKALVLGLAASVANPKNIALAVSGGSSMARFGATGADAVAAVILFVVVASLGVVAPIIVSFAMGDRSADVLGSWKSWLIANTATIMTVLFLVLGAKLVGSGLALFS